MNGRYNLLQIGLHWLIAFLVPIQYLTGGSIERTHHAVHMGMAPSDWDIIQHHIHSYSGMSIGALMAARLLIRFLFPPTPVHGGSRTAIAAQLLHFAFYAAIIAQAALGFVASYIWFGVAPWHVVIAKIILGMVAIHFLAAVWHTLIRKDETLDRMVVPRRSVGQ